MSGHLWKKMQEIIFWSLCGEAQRRGVFHVEDMKKLSHEEYEVKWNQFCDAFFDRASLL